MSRGKEVGEEEDLERWRNLKTEKSHASMKETIMPEIGVGISIVGRKTLERRKGRR